MRILRDSTALTLLFSLLLICMLGLARPASENSGIQPDQFWARKLCCHRCADVVILGDSRAFRGLSPTVMQEEIPGARVVNYAFSANGYSTEYLNSVESILQPEYSLRIVILCITPRTLTQTAITNNGFLDLQRKHPVDLWLTANGGFVPGLLAPYEFPDILAGLRGGYRKIYYSNEYQHGGFIASTREPENQLLQLSDYETIFQTSQVSEQAVQDLLDQVRGWEAENIFVYGLRPPVGNEMYELEQQLSGFNERDFRQCFEKAGGYWIELNQEDYHTYDGSHLRKDSAMQYTRDVAQSIKRELMLPGTVQ